VKPPPISVYMITFNNARTVERALKSVGNWADEIVVVDSFSTDATPEVAGRFAGRFLQRPWPGFRDQYQFAAEQCRNDWVLFIDADEEISPGLAAELREELARNLDRPEEERVCGYACRRRTYFLGRWIRHGGWVPDHEIRLYDRRFGRWEGALHAKVEVRGRTALLRNYYYHYTYADIADQISTINRYSSTAAADMDRSGRRFSLAGPLFHPPARFLRDYILKRGFLDGLPGFIIAVNTMFHVFAKHTKLWERQRAPRPFPPDNDQPAPQHRGKNGNGRLQP